jgi:hypothetical protein
MQVENLIQINKFLKQYNVCCVCLNEERLNYNCFLLNQIIQLRKYFSDGFNELVSCDSCGFYTHEGCYGITDTESKQSTNSLASTEPWFCNSCLNVDLLVPLKNSIKNEIKLSKRQC